MPRIAYIFATLAAACGSSPAPAIGNTVAAPSGAALPPVVSLMPTTICLDRGGGAIAMWPAIDHEGELFLALDASGYVATVRIREGEPTCLECPKPSIEGTIVDRGTPREKDCFTGIGPVARPMPRAAIVRHVADTTASAHVVTDWAVTDEIDLDGDRRPDVAIVARCAQVVSSGCTDHVCSRACDALRDPRAPALPVAAELCTDLAPEPQECKP